MIPVELLHDAEQRDALRAANGVQLGAEHARGVALTVLPLVLLAALLFLAATS